jgi:hypothetical protein
LYGTFTICTWASSSALGAEAEQQLGGLGARQLDQLGQRGHGHLGVGDEQERHERHVRHRREVGHRVVRHLRVQARIGGERPRIAQPDRVAVGRGLRDHGDAGVARLAGAVLQHHGLAQPLGERRLQHARDRVGRAPRGERDDEADRLGRIRGLRRGRGQPASGGGGEQAAE